MALLRNGQRRDADQTPWTYVVNQKMGFMAAKHFVQMHHEFPNDPDAVHALKARVVALIRADEFGADIGETMEFAYSRC